MNHADVRLLRLWVRFADTQQDPLRVFQSLQDHGIGLGHALLYEAWAVTLERKHSLFPEADAIYCFGIEQNAEPIERLRRRHSEFKERMRKMQSGLQNAVPCNQATSPQESEAVKSCETPGLPASSTEGRRLSKKRLASDLEAATIFDKIVMQSPARDPGRQMPLCKRQRCSAELFAKPPCGSPDPHNSVRRDDVIKEGYLVKQSRFLKQWRTRWFVLTPKELSSFKFQDMQEDATEIIPLCDCTDVKPSDATTGKENSFELHMLDRVFYITAASSLEKESWITAIKRAIAQGARDCDRLPSVRPSWISKPWSQAKSIFFGA